MFPDTFTLLQNEGFLMQGCFKAGLGGLLAVPNAHLTQCRAEACPSIRSTHHGPPTPEQTLVIHAECSTILKSLPWYIHLRPATTDYDKAMRPPASVWL